MEVRTTHNDEIEQDESPIERDDDRPISAQSAVATDGGRQ